MTTELRQKAHTWLLSICAILLLISVVMQIRSEQRQERFLDYGRFQGEYETEARYLRRELARLDQEMQTERAWSTSIKGDLRELSQLMNNEQARQIIERMINQENGG